MTSDQAVVQWFRQMATLLQCGLPARRALQVCGEQTSDKKLQHASLALIRELGVGQRLSQAMRMVGAPFGEIHCGAVEVGERDGDLSLVFQRLADLVEETSRIKRRLLSALAYPALVFSVSLFGLYLLVRFLAPVLADVGAQLNQDPNPFSQVMLWLGYIFERELLTLFIGVTSAVAGYRTVKWLWTHHRLSVERVLFRLPLVGKILRFCVLIRICQTLETVICGGFPLTEGFKLTGKTCGSRLYAREVLEKAEERIKDGESVCNCLRDCPGLPASFMGLVVAGEESGRLDQTFAFLSRLYEMELISAIESFLGALEPISIAVVGTVVLGVLLSVFAPLSELLTAF